MRKSRKIIHSQTPLTSLIEPHYGESYQTLRDIDVAYSYYEKRIIIKIWREAI